MKKTLLVLVLAIAALTVPNSVFAGTSFFIGGNSHGGFGVSISHQHYGGCGHQRVIRHSTTTIVRGGSHYPVYREQRVRIRHGGYDRHPHGRVHRQEGRTYYQGGHGRRVIVVPSGRYHGGYRY